MLKKTLHVKGARILTSTEQKEIKGGFGGFGCNQQILAQCFDDSDCPCNRTCGVSVEVSPGEFIEFADVCQFI